MNVVLSSYVGSTFLVDGSGKAQNYHAERKLVLVVVEKSG